MPASWASVLLAAAALWILAGFEVVGVVLASVAVVIEVGVSLAVALSESRTTR